MILSKIPEIGTLCDRGPVNSRPTKVPTPEGNSPQSKPLDVWAAFLCIILRWLYVTIVNRPVCTNQQFQGVGQIRLGHFAWVRQAAETSGSSCAAGHRSAV